MGIDELHFVTHVELTQKPKHGRVSARAVQVSGNHGTAPVARARTASIQTDITPGALPGRVHSTIWLNAHRLDGALTPYELLLRIISNQPPFFLLAALIIAVMYIFILAYVLFDYVKGLRAGLGSRKQEGVGRKKTKARESRGEDADSQ